MPLHADWKLIVKMHPLEAEVDKYLAEASERVDVLPVSASLNEALSKAKIQVSIYSTTFFDALGFGVKNYSLTDIGYSADYANEMVEMSVAERLGKEEDVIKKFETDQTEVVHLTRADVFASFQPRLMKF